MVYSLKLKAITPILIGGYDTCTKHADLGSEKLRPLSIKGVWRWWARVLVSTAFYNKNNQFIDIQGADRILAPIFGTARGRASASKYQIIVEDIDTSRPRPLPLGKLQSIPRVNLLMSRRRGGGRVSIEDDIDRRISEDEILPTGSQFSLALYKQSQTETYEDEFAACSLVLALTFGGVGKATSRGFGKLFPSMPPQGPDKLKTIYEKLQKLRTPPSRLGIGLEEKTKFIEEIFKLCVDTAQPLIEKLPAQNVKTYKQPVTETLADGFYRITLSKLYDGYNDALKAIGWATMKQYWKRLPSARGKSSFQLNTWILGLPRKRKIRSRNTDSCKQIWTGYLASKGCRKDSDIRRRSPIIFVPIETQDYRSYYVIVLGFKTYDWEYLNLTHRSAYDKEISMTYDKEISTNEKAIDQAFDEALNFIKEIMWA
ncbi:MAG: type III-B CRISPR module RAMP protein Cmr1 [Thermofilaceae archaeon]|nr:type III-B CRISPR module RAMP protein Cmr1 [Thermofilaceae archaeon]